MENIIFYVEEHFSKKRIDFIIQNKLPQKSRTFIQFLIKNSHVKVDNNIITKNSSKLKTNQKIEINFPKVEKKEINKENIPLDIVYEDNHIAIINKPSNMIVHPSQNIYTGTLVNALLFHFSSLANLNPNFARPGIVHRLDKNTSGLIIIAKTNLAYENLIEQFKNKSIKKTYLAISKGNFKEKSFRIENLIGRDPKERKRMAVVNKNGKIAISNFKVIDETTNFSLLKINIETGRTHQIRAHLKYLNHPILGDEIYGSFSKIALRQMLHAYSLDFNHPITDEKMFVKSNPPEDFLKTLKFLKLRLNKIEIKENQYE